MKPFANRLFVHQLVIVAVASVALFTNLGATRFWDQDEAYFAGTAAEMHARGDWITPYFNQELFAHKPPLMYWLMMIGYNLFGRTEFAARLGSALLGVATGILVYHTGRRLFSPTVGLWAGLAIVTCLMFDVVARAATPDCHLVFFTTLALYFFLTRCPEARLTASSRPAEEEAPAAGRRREYLGWSLVYASMGVAVLVKGPIGFLLPACVIGLYLMLTMPRTAVELTTWKSRLFAVLARLGPFSFARALWRMKPWLLVAMLLLVAGPWFLLVDLRTGGAFSQEFFWKHHVERFLEPLDNHQGPWWYYVPAMLAGFFPWSVFAVPTAIELVREIRRGGRRGRACLLLLCWAGVFVVFFSKASTKLPNYVLPAYPALAVAVGCYLERWLRVPQVTGRLWTRVALGATAVTGVLLAAAYFAATFPLADGETLLTTFQASPLLEHDLVWVAWLGVVPIVGAALCLLLDACNHRRWMAPTFAAMSLIFVTGALGGVALRIDRHQLSETVARAIDDGRQGDAARVAQFGFFRPSLVYYTAGRLEACASPDDVAEFLATGDDAFVIMPAEEYSAMESTLPRGVAVLTRQSRFPKQGEIVVLSSSLNAPSSSSRTARKPPAIQR